MALSYTINATACGKQKYVISSCAYTFQGYQLLLKEQGINASRIFFEGDDVSHEDVNEIILNKNAEISVFLGREAVSLLGTLKKLAGLLNALPVIRPVLLYGKVPDSWLYFTLENLVSHKSKLSLVKIASLSDIENSFRNPKDILRDNSRSLVKESFHCAYKSGMKYLTKREFEVLLNHFRGMTVQEQCKRMELSNKTIYTHRKEGLRKLQLIHTWINDFNASRVEKIRGRNNEKETLSKREMEIFSALIKRDIFPVYQIITNSSKRVIGFEILLRWNQNGKIVKPVQFLSDVLNVEVWLKITALVIHAAVSGINKYNGKYYFSVNIPPQLASGNALPGMAKKAIEMLLKPEWADKLVFEFAETIDVTRNKEIPETMQRLRNTGCRLFLDDCFSNHQVMFPVRQVRFDGLKLDRDIIEHFVANDNDYNLIKAIQMYSDMTGSDCVAEGVDSQEKFDKLVALGVKSFQGYYFSKAVKEEELDRMVRMFS
ncbi:EAL domain-containing protein [unidentified bacterial endosymbiont]|uniref:EAL domain-containing protein n=1 Tax=unidentified bacterial endosymbiont TaxID=2355 RepID=UPI00209FEAB4|nr:EAL domain-containing protein [unidentified bacterial endosymbiont]